VLGEAVTARSLARSPNPPTSLARMVIRTAGRPGRRDVGPAEHAQWPHQVRSGAAYEVPWKMGFTGPFREWERETLVG
jgi:hypothetical protein